MATSLVRAGGARAAALSRRSPQLLVGIVLMGIVLAAALAVAPRMANPNRQDGSVVLKSPSRAHPLGTDNVGRDQLSRVLYGARASLMVSLGAVGIAAVIGIPLGLVGGYYGGLLDQGVSVVADTLLALPAMVLALTMSATLGPGLRNTMLAIGIIYVPQFLRMVRGQTAAAARRLYVESARAAGATDLYVLAVYILPNILAPLLANTFLMISTATLAEASLSFLGVGIQPPAPSWGYMLRMGASYIQVAPWLSLYPGLAIFVSILGTNLMSDGLQRLLVQGSRAEEGSE